LLDWDFARAIADTEHVEDASGIGQGATAVHLPARGVKSSNWDGLQIDWRAAPEQYAAIHFHDDDLADAGWQVSHVLDVPPDWPSACYALRLLDDENEWRVPFFVRPARHSQRAKVAYLIPTATYAAYANMNLRVRAPFNEMNQGRVIVLDDTDLLMLGMPELGKSTYDSHSDGSAVIYSSLRRPVTNFRPKGRIYKFCLDLLLVDWLEHEGVHFDVLTDEDLHREGASALDGYEVTILATHPEYYSRNMLDALESYVRDGGRMMVLGGNVFWWDSEFHPTRAGTVEVRRPGVQTLWSTDLSESIYNFVPAPGGEWRKIGRRPAALSGSMYLTIGFDECRPYRRSAVVDQRASFIFSEVQDEVIGDFGLLAGGASGYEIDRASAANGTPRHALRVASSFDHSNNFENMLESWADRVPAGDDGPEPVRADMVLFGMPSGGAVFSVGSIAWAGSLSHNGYDNNVRQVTWNVLERFLDPTGLHELASNEPAGAPHAGSGPPEAAGTVP
jgi:N,N-dimethylformamidase